MSGGKCKEYKVMNVTCVEVGETGPQPEGLNDCVSLCLLQEKKNTKHLFFSNV